MATEKFLDLSKFPGLDVQSFKMRSLTGEDLISSAARCAPAEGTSLEPTIFSLQMRQQQIAQSIIEVNGEQVRGPCLAFMKWNSRTRELVTMAYDHINGVSSSEREDFAKALIGAAPSLTQSVESAAG